jgi:hypothetical protein
MAALHSPLCIWHSGGASTPAANFSPSLSIFTPATLPTPVGQILSNPNYFAHHTALLFKEPDARVIGETPRSHLSEDEEGELNAVESLMAQALPL